MIHTHLLGLDASPRALTTAITRNIPAVLLSTYINYSDDPEMRGRLAARYPEDLHPLITNPNHPSAHLAQLDSHAIPTLIIDAISILISNYLLTHNSEPQIVEDHRPLTRELDQLKLTAQRLYLDTHAIWGYIGWDHSIRSHQGSLYAELLSKCLEHWTEDAGSDHTVWLHTAAGQIKLHPLT